MIYLATVNDKKIDGGRHIYFPVNSALLSGFNVQNHSISKSD